MGWQASCLPHSLLTLGLEFECSLEGFGDLGFGSEGLGFQSLGLRVWGSASRPGAYESGLCYFEGAQETCKLENSVAFVLYIYTYETTCNVRVYIYICVRMHVHIYMVHTHIIYIYIYIHLCIQHMNACTYKYTYWQIWAPRSFCGMFRGTSLDESTSGSPQFFRVLGLGSRV